MPRHFHNTRARLGGSAVPCALQVGSVTEAETMGYLAVESGNGTWLGLRTSNEKCFFSSHHDFHWRSIAIWRYLYYDHIYIYIIYDILDHFVMFDFIALGACAVRLSQVGRHVCFSPGVGGFVSDGSTVLYSVKESGEVVIGVDDGPVAWPSERGRPLC